MSESHRQLLAFLEPYQGKNVTATITELSEGKSAVRISNGDWSESDASLGIAKAFCEGYGIEVADGSAPKYTIIGGYTPETDEHEAIIEREFFGQGYIFKDEEAFDLYPDKVCYIPELSNATYTRSSLVAMCNGQERFAKIVFESVDWQHPESFVEEQFTNNEWDECPKCGHWFSLWEDGKPPCAECGAVLDYREGQI